MASAWLASTGAMDDTHNFISEGIIQRIQTAENATCFLEVKYVLNI